MILSERHPGHPGLSAKLVVSSSALNASEVLQITSVPSSCCNQSRTRRRILMSRGSTNSECKARRTNKIVKAGHIILLSPSTFKRRSSHHVAPPPPNHRHRKWRTEASSVVRTSAFKLATTEGYPFRVASALFATRCRSLLYVCSYIIF